MPVDKRVQSVSQEVDSKKEYRDTNVRNVLESLQTIRKNIDGLIYRINQLTKKVWKMRREMYWEMYLEENKRKLKLEHTRI